MKFLILFALLSLASCYNPQNNCKDFKTGTFAFSTEINGVKKTTNFTRTQDLEIDSFEGKTDTASVRWVNDCEYIVEKLHPKNMAEHKAISIRILTTTKNSYTFEYGIVGSDNKHKGTATKIK